MPAKPPKDGVESEMSSVLGQGIFVLVLFAVIAGFIFVPKAISDYKRGLHWDSIFAEHRIESLKSLNKLCETFFVWQTTTGQVQPEFNQLCLERNKEFFESNGRK